VIAGFDAYLAFLIGINLTALGCGRLGFEQISGKSEIGDASVADAVVDSSNVSIARIAGGWGSIDLSMLGVTDWAHWGLNGVGGFNHKLSGNFVISDFKQIGTATLKNLSATQLIDPLSWSNGAPVSTANMVTTVQYIDTDQSSGDGFEVNIRADMSKQRLTLFVGTWCVRAHLTAKLDEVNGVQVVDAPWDVARASSEISRYQVDFQSASVNRTLTVSFVVDFNYCTTGDLGELWLVAAALQ
jgi:hypothetical protein